MCDTVETLQSFGYKWYNLSPE